MLVKDIMTPNVKCVRPEDTIQSAARHMREMDVGPMPVCGTDRDITIRATAEGKDPARTTVREVMTPEVTYVFDDQDVCEAADTMGCHQIRRVLVLNRDKRLVGIVSMGDLAVSGDKECHPDETLREVSQPSAPVG